MDAEPDFLALMGCFALLAAVVAACTYLCGRRK